MDKKREVRMCSTALRLETRADGEVERNVLKGHAAVFDQRTNLGFFDEVIKPGAFRDTLAEGSDVAALVDHDPSMIIARTRDGGVSGSLQLREDETGLAVEIEVANTTVGNDLLENVRNGNIDGMSFGFFVREDGDRFIEERGGRILRVITAVDLLEVSAVVFPAYSGTDLQQNSAETGQFELRSIKNVFESAENRQKEDEIEPESDENEATEDENEATEDENEVKAAENSPDSEAKEGEESDSSEEKEAEEAESEEELPPVEETGDAEQARAKLLTKRRRELLWVEHERRSV